MILILLKFEFLLFIKDIRIWNILKIFFRHAVLSLNILVNSLESVIFLVVTKITRVIFFLAFISASIFTWANCWFFWNFADFILIFVYVQFFLGINFIKKLKVLFRTIIRIKFMNFYIVILLLVSNGIT